MNKKELYTTMFYIKDEADKWYESTIIIEKGSTYKTQYSMIITCMRAFSCELLLKGILIFDKKSSLSNREKTHDLKQMFNNIASDEIKTKIKNNIKWNTKEMPNNDEQKDVKIQKFEEWLNQISSYFCELRYNYEQYERGETIYVCDEDIKELHIGLLKCFNNIYLTLQNNLKNDDSE